MATEADSNRTPADAAPSAEREATAPQPGDGADAPDASGGDPLARRFADFLHAADEWLWETDADHRCTLVLGRFRETTALDPDALGGTTLWAFAAVDPERAPDWRRLRDALAARRPFRDLRIAFTDADGRRHRWRLAGRPLFAADGAFCGFRGAAREETDEAEERGGAEAALGDSEARPPAQDALRDSEAQFRALIENAPLAIAFKDLDGRILMANRRYAAMVGAGDADVTGKTVYDLCGKQQADLFRAHERRVIETRCASQEEFEVRTSEGHRYYLEVKFPVLDAQAEVAGIGYFGADITERKTAEQMAIAANRALREKRRQFDIALGNMVQGLTLYDRDQRLVLCNQRYIEMYGLSPEVARPGAQLRELMEHSVAIGNYGPGESARVVAERLRMSGSHARSIFYQRLADGRVIEVVHQPLPDGGSVATFTDVTERERVQEALRASEERFRDVADVASDWIWEMDETFRFTYFSYRLKELAGREPKELLGKSPRQVLGAFVDEEAWRRHDAALAAREPIQDFQYSHVGRDGQRRVFSISGKPAFDSQGRFKGYRGTGADVTASVEAVEAQRAAKEQAEVANRTKSEFLANMSHELRTPLNAIIGFSEIMRDELLGPLGNAHYVEYARDIYDSGNHLLSLINDILDLSKIEAGKMQLEDASIDVAETVRASLKLVKPRVEAGRLTATVRMPEAMPRLRADPRALKQIFVNLLSNAVKFTPEGGRVTVSAELDAGGRPVLAVADTGIGIAQEDIPKALASFGQVDGPYSRAHQGTGLGLPLVKALAELHGGDLEIESGKKSGTTVRVRLPADRVLPPPDGGAARRGGARAHERPDGGASRDGERRSADGDGAA